MPQSQPPACLHNLAVVDMSARRVLPACVTACGCCVTGIDDAGLLHLATHMPQLLHLDVCSCHRITEAGLVMACTAAAESSEHGMVITDNVVYWQ
jgi:hypothetical protein